MAKTDGTDVANKLTAPKKDAFATMLDTMKSEIAIALPKHLEPERLLRIALTAFRTNEKLQNCNRTSILAALMQSAQLGLEPNTPLGEAYLIPYGNECQFQIGYRGMLSLAYRTGDYKMIYAHAVYKNDEFRFNYGLTPDLVHIPAAEPEGLPTHYYACYHLTNGGKAFRVWSAKQVKNHASKFSSAVKSGRKSPWETDPDAMALKTVLKDLLRYAPKSIEFARQLSMDETVKAELAQDMSEVIDVTPTETELQADWEKRMKEEAQA